MANDQTLLRVAHLYYRRGLTQQEIGARLNLGRVKVGRLLAEALRTGIVQIEIRHPLARLAELEDEIRARFGLEEVIVAEAPEDGFDDLLQIESVASAAAEYLATLRPAPGGLGISWGRTMFALASRMASGWATDVDVVQLNGAVSRSDTPTHADSVLVRAAESSGGRAYRLAAPAIVERPESRLAFEADRAIAETLDRARAADVAVFSLGALGPASVLVQSGYLTEDEMLGLRARGAVGDMLSRFITADGRICDPDLDARTVGLPLEELRGKRRAIGVACGAAKTDVTRGAIAGGFVNAVVIDETIATALLGDDAP